MPILFSTVICWLPVVGCCKLLWKGREGKEGVEGEVVIVFFGADVDGGLVYLVVCHDELKGGCL